MTFSLAFLTFALCAIAAPALTPPSFMLWRYRDLKLRGFVTSRAMLKIMIEQYGFPAGKMLTPNCRTWTQEEVLAYYASRPSDKKDTSQLNAEPWDWHAPRGKRRGRPPKNKNVGAEA
jgi:hypothetical protein